MIRILIAEPMTLTREGLVALFSRQRDIELAAAVEHCEEVVTRARAVRPGRPRRTQCPLSFIARK